MDVSRSAPGCCFVSHGRPKGGHLTHLMDLLINAIVILVALFAFSWLANNSSSPLAGKI